MLFFKAIAILLDVIYEISNSIFADYHDWSLKIYIYERTEAVLLIQM